MKYLVLRGKTHQPSSLYLVKLPFNNEGEIKPFSTKQKYGEFVTSRTALQEIVKEIILERRNIGQKLRST